MPTISNPSRDTERNSVARYSGAGSLGQCDEKMSKLVQSRRGEGVSADSSLARQSAAGAAGDLDRIHKS